MTEIWYPYTQMKGLSVYPEVVSGKAEYLQLADGRRVVDSVSSWWAVIHGYAHPRLDKVLIEQSKQLSHVMLGGLTHGPAKHFAKRLIEITPSGLNHVFFGDSGSVGVEVALKMAVQYWRQKACPEKGRFIALKKAYHGDTCGVMSVGDPDDGMHALFHAILPKQFFVSSPRSTSTDNSLVQSDLDELELLLKSHHHECAAMIVEPLMQGAGGFNFYHSTYLDGVRALCDQYDLLLIFDEVATGFGRTGTLFAADQTSISPDIMVLGKGLTAGYMGHSATLATTPVFDTFLGKDDQSAFMHGPTFMGNPLACAVGLESSLIFEEENYLTKIAHIESQLKERLLYVAAPKIRSTRVLGATGVIEFKAPCDLEGYQAYALEKGVWSRCFGPYLYTMPPYIISDKALHQILDVMLDWGQRP